MDERTMHQRLAGLAQRLDYIEEHLARIGAAVGYQYTPTVTQVPPEVLQLVRSGQMIAAIKRYREITGVGLAEAKAIVEGMG